MHIYQAIPTPPVKPVVSAADMSHYRASVKSDVLANVFRLQALRLQRELSARSFNDSHRHTHPSTH
jgi:hypothetical protein